MIKYFSFDDEIEVGKCKGKTVREIIDSEPNPKHVIFNLIKEWELSFSDEVLKEVHIKKIVHEPTFKHIVIDRKNTEQKALPKDKVKIDKIIEDLHTIDNSIDNIVIDDEENE